MKTYQAFAKTTENGEFVNTEIKARSIKQAKIWFAKNTVENERIFLKE